MSRTFHKDGTIPTKGEIFVFGSNLAGRHGLDAALAAKEKFGAATGVGRGLTGRAYGIPTKTANLTTRGISDILIEIEDFIAYAKNNPDQRFFVTRIGCGLAGFADADIAPLFRGAPNNCSLPDKWSTFIGAEG